MRTRKSPEILITEAMREILRPEEERLGVYISPILYREAAFSVVQHLEDCGFVIQRKIKGGLKHEAKTK